MVGWAGKGPGEEELTVALVAMAADPQGRVFALHPATCPERTGIFHVYTEGPVIPPAFAAGRRGGGEGSLAGHPHPGSCPQEPQGPNVSGSPPALQGSDVQGPCPEGGCAWPARPLVAGRPSASL